MSVVVEPVTGRYMRLDIGGRARRLYWEEAGSGIPLLCLHTAGADGRQDVLHYHVHIAGGERLGRMLPKRES